MAGDRERRAGELPQALEAIAGLPSAAEARSNRPALINGIRGQAMIVMFTGRIVEARPGAERAVEVSARVRRPTGVAALRLQWRDSAMALAAACGGLSPACDAVGPERLWRNVLAGLDHVGALFVSHAIVRRKYALRLSPHRGSAADY
jgi:hypothetical protein